MTMTSMPMYPPMTDGLPAPLRGSMDELIDAGDQNSRTVKTFIGANLGNRTFIIAMGMRDFYDQSAVANEVNEHGEVTQRKLDEAHAFELAKYMLRGVVGATVAAYERNNKEIPAALHQISDRVGRQPYTALQPIVANLRTCGVDGLGCSGERIFARYTEETVGFRARLAPRDILWVVDGQHRRAGMDILFRFLNDIQRTCKYPKKKGKMGSLYDYDGNGTMPNAEWKAWSDILTYTVTSLTIAVEVHLGLDFAQERQLFHDLNNRTKKVERSLALSFDSANPLNAFIRDELDGKIIKICDTDRKDWTVDDGQLPLKDMVAINSHLFLNKSNAGSADNKTIAACLPVARQFWTAVKAIPGFGQPGMFGATVAAQSVVLKALAKLTHDFAFGRKADPVLLNALLNGIKQIDFSHNNLVWRYYDLNDSQRALLTDAMGQRNEVLLSSYLPSMKKDIGRFDNGRMRFGTAHNDIYPVVGDMIRWMLRLPPR